MRVLLVQHGPPFDPARPVSGGALRAGQHAAALRGAGHEVLIATRAQDAPEGGALTYGSPRHLRALARELAPDRLLCVQPEEAPALAGLAPLCVDLYAPRLIEAVFEGAAAEEASRTLQALGAADHWLFSNPRQRWMYLGLLALAGVDLRATSGDVVPLAAPEGPPRQPPAEPLFWLAGVAWPWQDPVPGLRRLLAELERRGVGRVQRVGGRPLVGHAATVDLAAQLPPGPRLEVQGPLPYGALLQATARATVAWDWMEPNPERELAVSFRQLDALGCGLPLVTGGHHALAPLLRQWEAGWVLEHLDELPGVLDQLLGDPAEVERRAAQARALARAEFDPARAAAPLLRWVGSSPGRTPGRTPLLDAARLAAELASAQASGAAAEALRAEAQAEVALKRSELARLTAQNQDLAGSVAHLARAVDEVAGFRREAVRVLGARAEAAEGEAESLARELGDLRADLAKKDAELRAARRELDRLNDALAAAQDEAAAAGDRLLSQGRIEDRLRQELRRLRERLGR